MRIRKFLGFSACFGLCAWLTLVSEAKVQADEPKPLSDRELQFFEGKVRPLLVKHCYACHSTESGKAEGGLRVDTRAALLKGGDSGPAVVIGDSRRSILMRAVLYDDLKVAMPPADAGGKLKNEEIAVLDQWIKMGLPDPREDVNADLDNSYDEARKWWAFQPLQSVDVPAASGDWDRNAIDRFIAEGLREQGLKPSSSAAPETLLRRIHFDLTGLPPSFDDIQAFQASIQKVGMNAAYEARVDQLLSSRDFGVHWGRHWLDVARFAESSGRDINISYPYAWRYRDYVIDSFDRDKPYDQFLVEQLAGDLLPYQNSQDQAEKLVATGFLAVGSRALNEMNPRQFALDQADEQIDAVFQATMGLTVACARCHDHKFDPIPQKDYTAVAGIFLSTKTLYGVPGLQQGRNSAKPLALPDDAKLPHVLAAVPKKSIDDMVQNFDEITREMDEMRRERFQQMAQSGNSVDLQREVRRRQTLERQKGNLEARLMEYDDSGRPVALTMGVLDKPAVSNASTPFPRFVSRDFRGRTGFETISDSPFFARGELDLAGDKIPRGVPNILGNADQVTLNPSSSGRLELAQWIVDRNNPMTARVAVNRIWNWLIGQGIVASVDNFGTTGNQPTHPALLDYLAKSFQENWSTKALVRQIVLSATYQQASTFHEEHFTIDPENAYLWRMNPRRLDGESIRDAVLLTSGTLDTKPTIGSSVARNGLGPIDRPPLLGPMYQRPSLGSTPTFFGRSIYLGLPRDAQPELLALFDAPDAASVQGKRECTNVPAQSLFMMNSDWIAEQAAALAQRILAVHPGKVTDRLESRVELAYQLTLGRKPTASEHGAAKQLISAMGSNPTTAWTSLARGLYASAEFRYLD
jgi:hypothetical protein